MKIEKRIIALCICALAIGATTMLPIVYFSPTTNATSQGNSWFNLRVDHAYFSANIVDGIYERTNVLGIEPSVNLDAFNNQEGTRIEYFEIIYYTDDMQLLKVAWSIGANNTYSSSVEPENFVKLARTEWFSDPSYIRGGGGYYYDLLSHINVYGYIGISQNSAMEYMEFADDNTFPEEYSAILAAVENKQTVYVDIIRAGYTTFDGTDIAINSSDNRVVIQRLELTKNGDAFMFGNTDAIEVGLSKMEQLHADNVDRLHENTEKNATEPKVGLYAGIFTRNSFDVE